MGGDYPHLFREGQSRSVIRLETVSSPSQNRPALVLRELSSRGRFVRSITCHPGEVAVLASSENGEFDGLKEALLGQRKNLLDMRLGEDELHPSEVYEVDIANYSWKQPTISAILQTAGAPPAIIPELLRELGLAQAARLPAEQLDKCEMRRLCLACSFFAKSTILLYDRPFSVLTAEWREKMALFLVESIRASQRISLVFIDDAIPELWKDYPDVQIVGSKSKKKKELTRTSSRPSSDEQTNIGKLLDIGMRSSTGHGAIITRPQRVRKPTPRISFPKAMQAEAIPNPNFLKAMQNISAESGPTEDELQSEYLLLPRPSRPNRTTLTSMPKRTVVIKRMVKKMHLRTIIMRIRNHWPQMKPVSPYYATVLPSVKTGSTSILHRKQVPTWLILLLLSAVAALTLGLLIF